MKSTKLFLVLMIVLLLIITSCSDSTDPGGGGGTGADTSGPVNVIIQNNTSWQILYCYVRQPGTDIWTACASGQVANGSSWTVTIPRIAINSQNRADIQLRSLFTIVPGQFTKLSQAVTQNGTITFTTSDADPAAGTVVTIRNNTGVGVTHCFAIRPDIANLGYVFYNIGVELLSGGSIIGFIPPQSMNSQNKTNLELVASNGNRYEKTNYTIVPNSTITFTASDLRP